jgi:hypothetical protein
MVAVAVTDPWWDTTKHHRTWTIGLDLGQAQDYTAIVILERFLQPIPEIDPATGNQRSIMRYEIPYLERPPLGTSYVAIVERVAALMRSPELTRWEKKKMPNGDRMPVLIRPALVVDKTGVGAPVVDLLKAANLSPIPVLIHGGSEVIEDFPGWRVPKRNLIASLLIAFQNRDLEMAKSLPLTATLVSELKNFRAKINIATAHDSYETWREGQHDDLLLGAALALWHSSESRKHFVGKVPIRGF